MQYVVRAVLCFGQARLLGNTRGSSLFCTADVHMYTSCTRTQGRGRQIAGVCARVHQALQTIRVHRSSPCVHIKPWGIPNLGAFLQCSKKAVAYTRCARSDAASICSHKRALDISPCLCDTVFKSFSHVQSRSGQIRGKHFFYLQFLARLEAVYVMSNQPREPPGHPAKATASCLFIRTLLMKQIIP